MGATEESPEAVAVRIGGRTRRLRRTNRTAFRMDPYRGQVARSTGTFGVCVGAWALLDEANPRETPEDLAALLLPEETEAVTEAVIRLFGGGEAAEEDGETATEPGPQSDEAATPEEDDPVGKRSSAGDGSG